MSKKGKTKLLTASFILLALFRFLMIEIAPRFVPIGILFISSCADERPPSGGRKDSVPPKIKYAYPENKSLNFHSTKIKIRFNEFIQQTLDPKEILISPPMDKKPKMVVNGKNLSITFKSKLKDSTTYTINFGDAIKDLNEGNTLKNFTYVFATGSKLDTASISGNLINVSNPQDLDNIIISLYPIDSIDGILHSKPFYFAKTDKAGKFIINNIHPGSYNLYALRDQNLNYIYDQADELIGFADSSLILIDSSKTKINLSVFLSTNNRPKFTDALAISPGKILITYNAPIKSLQLNSDSLSSRDKVDINDKKDTITYWYSNIYIKKLRLSLIANDTINDSMTVDLKAFSKDSTNNNKKYSLSFESQLVKIDSLGKSAVIRPILSPFKPIILNLTRPVDSIAQNKHFVVINDSTLKTDSISFTFEKKTKRKITINFHQLEKTPYTIVVPDSMFLDIFGWWNRKFYYKWISDASENYGNIILNIKFTDPEKHYVFRVLDQDNKVIETFYYVGKDQQTETLKNVKAGTYHLDAIDDLNNNGEWDSGNFSKKIQPERIINLSGTYEVKGNWDLEIDVKL
jgi:uncharacterized protein (DUF2141 family)